MVHRSRSRRLRGAVALAGVLAAVALAPGCELAEIPEDVCGNRVVEPAAGEACDYFVDGPGLTCGEPGTVGACLFVCDGSREYRCEGCCPAGQACGQDGLCKRPTGTFRPAAEPLGAGAEELEVGDLDGDDRLDVVRMLDEGQSVVFGAPRDEVPVEHASQFEPLFLPVTVKRSPGPGAGSGQGGADAGSGQAGADAGSEDSQTSDLIVSRLGISSYHVAGAHSLIAASLPALPLPEALGDLATIGFQIDGSPFSGSMIWHVAWQVGSVSTPVWVGGEVSAEGTQDMGILAYPHDLPSAFSREPIVAHIDVRPESPCQDIVLGYLGDDTIEFYNPCVEDPTLPGKFVHNACSNPFVCPPDLPRKIDVGGPLARGPFVVDLNGDGYLDLVAQVETTATSGCGEQNPICYETRSALGVGNGTFHSDPSSFPPVDGEGDNALAPNALLTRAGDPILALADLDGRGLIDVVTDRLVQVNFSTPDGVLYAYEVATNPGDRWTEAVVADFDRQGGLDVAATSRGDARLYFYLGVGNGLLNPFTVALSAPLAQLHVGDYDGDLVPDLLGVGQGPDPDDPEGATADEVTVLWGSPAGPPEPPEILGRTNERLTISTGKVAAEALFTVRGMSDGIDDIMAVGRSPDSYDSVHVFFGRSDREVRSALGLVAGEFEILVGADIRPQLARKVVAGHFDTRFSAEQLAVVTSEPFEKNEATYNYQLWFVPELGRDFKPGAPVQASEPIDRREVESAAVWELGLYVAVDIDGDGADELVALAPRWSDPDRSSYRIGRVEFDEEGEPSWRLLPQGGPGDLEVAMFRYAGPTAPCRDPYYYPLVTDCAVNNVGDIVATEFDMPLANGRLRACDIDGDPGGREELVVLSRDAAPGEPSLPGELLSYAFDGALELRSDGFVPIEVDLPAGTLIYDFACLDANEQPGQEIAVTSSTGVYLLHRASPADPWVADAVPETDHYLRSAAGDVDGDGLDDLVVGSLAETRVLYGQGEPRVGEASP